VEEFPRHAGLGHVKKEVGECSKTESDPPTINDEGTLSHSSDIKGSMNIYQWHIWGKCSKTTQKVWRINNHCSHSNEVGH